MADNLPDEDDVTRPNHSRYNVAFRAAAEYFGDDPRCSCHGGDLDNRCRVHGNHPSNIDTEDGPGE